MQFLSRNSWKTRHSERQQTFSLSLSLPLSLRILPLLLLLFFVFLSFFTSPKRCLYVWRIFFNTGIFFFFFTLLYYSYTIINARIYPRSKRTLQASKKEASKKPKQNKTSRIWNWILDFYKNKLQICDSGLNFMSFLSSVVSSAHFYI